MRSLALLLAVAGAYALLRGFPEDWHVVLKAALAAVVLGIGVLVWCRRDRRGSLELPPSRPVGVRNLLGFAGAVLVLEVVLWTSFGTMPSRLESVAESFEAWLSPATANQGAAEGSAQEEARGGHWLINKTRMRPLPKRTNLKPGNRPEVFVQPLDNATDLVDERLYVHAFALSEFQGGAWRIGSKASWDILADADGWVRFAEGSAQPSIECRIFHGYQKGGENMVLGLQGLEAVNLPQVEQVDAGLHLLPPPEFGSDGYRYVSSSRPTTLDQLVGKQVVIPEEIPSRLLEVPGGALGFRIADLARLVQGEGEVVDRLLRIRNHLRTTLDYSLVTENVDSRDPLENFLFHEQRGHCEFFATAGALLARAAGVPSRVCYGWTGGTYYQTSGYFVFRANEAHAWTEVLLDGWGWVVLDPTPPGGLVADAPRVAGTDEKPPGLDENDSPDNEVIGGGKVWMPLLLLLAGLPCLWVLMLRALRKGGGVGREVTSGVARPTAYREAFLNGCRARGVKVSPGATLRSLGSALEETPGFYPDLLDYHYAVAYEGSQEDREIEQSLERRIRAWSKEGK